MIFKSLNNNIIKVKYLKNMSKLVKFVILSIIPSYCLLSISNHPITQEIVDYIKERSVSWEPMEIKDNPFYYKSVDEINSMFGIIQ